jgi:CopG family transcriptional regulator, nickel-responsive regulator
MSVISVSLPDEAVGELDRIVRQGGFRGRSDAVRNAVKNLSSDFRKSAVKGGRVSGVLVLVHDERHEQAFTKARHDFEGLIKTSVHNQLGSGKCLELFILDGEPSKVSQLMKSCRKSGRAQYLKLVTGVG